MLAASPEADLEGHLRMSLARLVQELPLVYEIEPEEVHSACLSLEGRIAEIAHGLRPSLDLLFPGDLEVDLRSEKLGLTGRLDRLAPGLIPSIIRTGQAPQDGVWKRDRLMLAGYSLLLGEKYGKRINRGMVEYPRYGAVRQVEIHAVDRSRVLRLRDRVAQIREGRLPDRPESAPCDGCEERQRCETRVSLASKFF